MGYITKLYDCWVHRLFIESNITKYTTIDNQSNIQLGLLGFPTKPIYNWVSQAISEANFLWVYQDAKVVQR